MKTLIPLYSKVNFKIKKNNLFLGRWCIPFDKENKLSLKNCLNYHWKNKKKRLKDFQNLEILFEKILINLSKKLNYVHKTNLSIREWRVILGPWLMIFLTKSFDSFENLNNFVKKNRFVKIDFFKISHSDVIPKDYMDYIKNYLDFFKSNQYIYQKIISSCFKKQFLINNKKLKIKEKNNFLKIAKKNNLFANFLKSFFNSMIGKIYFDYLYINLGLKIKIFLLTRIFPNFLFDKIHFPEKNFDNFEREQKLNLKYSNKFEKFVNDNLFQFLPLSYLENFKILQSKAIKLNFNANKIFSNGTYIHNDFFKIWLSTRLKKRAKFYIMFHGGGVPAKVRIFNHDEKISDKILVWHKPVNNKQIQLPNLTLRNKKIQLKKKIILITLEPNISFYPVRTDDGPISTIFLDDLEQKISLSKLLIKKSQSIKIRSLTTSIWEFKKRIVKSLGRKHFDDNKRFTDSLRNSKIHISGYLSTTFGESITYDIPTLGLISKDVYDFSDQFNYVIKLLKKNQILFDDPIKLYQFLKRHNFNLDKWWYTKNIRKTVEIYKKDLLGYSDYKIPKWISFIKD